MKKPLKIVLQHLCPQHFLSRIVAKLANCQTRIIKDLFICWFAKHYQVNMAEAIEPDCRKYSDFNNFFTRSIKPETRPIAAEQNAMVSPVDGRISQFGKIENNRLFQAKGFYFNLEKLLGNDKLANLFRDGTFITMYLSPSDYHRIHMPFTGVLQQTLYVPGRLFAVNPKTTQHVPELFARNERAVNIFATVFGPMAVIFVGALIVASIETAWAGVIAPNSMKNITTWNYEKQNIVFQKGSEIGKFKLGSTVILLFPQNTIKILENIGLGGQIKMGQLLGNCP